MLFRSLSALPADLVRALDAFFARSTGAYGVLIATPERILCERYSDFGSPDRATPSWSMTEGDHLYRDRPVDPRRLARFGA